MIDYHIHTPLCGHAAGSMEDYVQEAISKNLKEVCFLDHFTKRAQAPRNSMTEAEIPIYVSTARKLKARYADKIAVKVGLEIDFNPAHVSRIEDIIGTYHFDCIGSSIHFIGECNIVSRHAPKNDNMLSMNQAHSLYLERLYEMLSHSYFDIVCHLDVIKKFGSLPGDAFDSSYKEIIAQIKEKGFVVEVNTSGYYHPVREAYPSRRLLSLCRAAGMAITLGSDAHHPAQVGRGFAKATAMLKDVGYHSLTTFEKRIKKQVPFDNVSQTR